MQSPTPLRHPILARAFDYPPGADIPPHSHATGQFDYATSGVMTVTTEHGTWVVPSSRAVWIPPRVAHEARITGAVAMRTVYIDPVLCEELPNRCTVVSVSPLLRELILAVIAVEESPGHHASDERLRAVLLDQVRLAEAMPSHLAHPREPGLRALTDALIRDPADDRTIKQCAATLGLGTRTFARMFQRETGMTFGAWKQQLRLMESMRLLASGASVTAAATATGYDSTSAFIAMFRRAMGVSPGKFFAESGNRTRSSAST